MALNLIQLTDKAHKLVKQPYVICPNCGEKWYALFDKLFVHHTDVCCNCEDYDIEEFDRIASNIETILEAIL